MSVVKSITSPMKFLIQAGLLADLGKHIEQYGKKAAPFIWIIYSIFVSSF